MDFSPVVIDRLKKAQGKVRVQPGISPMMCNLQVQENGAWITLLANQPRGICESAVRQAGQTVILG